MKPLLLLTAPLLLLLPACASKSAKQVIVTSSPPATGRTLGTRESITVRHGEIVRAYPVGRYVDPASRKVMHEAHTLYRIEQSPRWNLAGPRSAAPVETRHPVPMPEQTAARDVLAVELNRQRQATQAVTRSGEAVTARLKELGTALERTQTMAQQNLRLQEDQKVLQRRLEELESRLREVPGKKGDLIQPGEAPW